MSHAHNDVTISEEKIDFIQPYSNLFDHQELGSGHFGVTYLSTLKRANQSPLKVVCKVSKTKPGEDEWHEMQNLYNLKLHPLVVRLLGICMDWQGAAIALLFEYHPGGTLEKIAREQHVVQPDADGADLLKMAYAMACSVQHIHANRVLHRDIALRNFVVSSGGLPVLIDFGMSRGNVEYRSVGGKPGPWRSMPPEALGAELLSMPKSDVYMLGIAYWQLYNGMEAPFPHASSPVEHLRELNTARESAPDATAPLRHSETMPQVMRDLVARMCSLRMEGRPSAAEVCNILAEHVSADLHRLSNSSLDVDLGHRGREEFDLAAAVSEYEYTPLPVPQPRDTIAPHASTALTPQRRSVTAPEALNTASSGSLEQEHEHEMKSSEVPSETPTRPEPAIDDHDMRKDDAEPSMSARGKVLLEHIESAGVYNPKAVTHALRHEQIEASDLRDLTEEELRRLFPKVGAFIRMKKFINREPSLTNRGQALYNDLQYLKLQNVEGLVRLLRKENIDMDLLTRLSNRELEEVLSKVSEVGTRKLLRKYVRRIRKAKSLLPDPLRRIYEVSSTLFRTQDRSTDADDDGWTKLHIAATEGDALRIESILMERRVDPNARTNTNETALHIASKLGKASAVAMLLSYKRVNIHAVDDRGNTALHNAAKLSDTIVLSCLLEDGRLDPNTRNERYKTPLHVAALNRSDSAIAVLLADDRTDVTLMDENDKNVLQLAAKRSGARGLSCLLKDGRLDPNCRLTSQKTPLHLAVQECNNAILALLLSDDRVDVNAEDVNGENALHLAARGHQYYVSHFKGAMLPLLLKDKRFDPNSRNKREEAPLHVAVQYQNDAAVVTLLSDERVDANAANEKGETALHYATQFGNCEALARLLKIEHVDPNSRNRRKEAPLHIAVRGEKYAAVATLLSDERVDANAANEEGETALHYAAHFGNCEALARLLKIEYVDPNCRNNCGQTPLHEAARKGRYAVVAMLLSDDRVDVRAVDKKGQSVMHHASMRRLSIWNQAEDLPVFSLLLKDIRLDPNARNKRQETPLHVASREYNHIQVSSLLSDKRVDVHAVDKNGGNALLNAKRCQNSSVYDLLVRDGRFDSELLK